MKLNQIARPEGYKKAKPPKGRGQGTGNGKTAGKGHKGQKARSGYKSRAWFEGGQMPINRRLPKRGFRNPFSKFYQIVNLRDLERLGDATEVDATALMGAGIIKNANKPVKLLADGSVERAYTVQVDKASKAAIEAIQAAGGEVTVKSA